MNYDKLKNIQRGTVRVKSNDKEDSGSKHTVAILYDNKFYAKSNRKPHEFIPIKINQEDLNNVDKIDEIFEVKNIDEILPKQYRITKNEYIKALENEKTRKEVLKKLDSSLDFLYQSSHTSFF